MAMIATSNKIGLRAKLLDACIAKQQFLINDFRERIKALTEPDGLGNEYIGVDSHINPEGTVFRYCYGGNGKVHVLKNEDGSRHFVKLKLRPGQLVILANSNVTYPFS